MATKRRSGVLDRINVIHDEPGSTTVTGSITVEVKEAAAFPVEYEAYTRV